jgi:hypothetical protein
MKKFQKFRVSNLIDPLSKLNGIRFNSLYVQFGEGEQKDKVYVQKKEITGKYFSTMYTVCGSLVWLALLILSATSTLSRWGRFEPAINEVNLEDEGVSLALPDIAITFSVNDFHEGELLDYVWPVFSWVNENNGFTNRDSSFELINGVSYGHSNSDCQLKAGYRRNPNGSDEGPMTWPVFCLKNSKKQLKGRFGDDVWSFLSLRVYKCGCTKCSGLTPALEEIWKDKGSGTCKVLNETAFGDLPFNIWFRFPREDWKNYFELQPPKGMIKNGGWKWWIYEVLKPNQNLDPKLMTIELRHNTAIVNTPSQLIASNSSETRTQWFDWSGFQYSPTGTQSSDFINSPMFSAALRIAWLRREVSVRYFTIWEAFSQISGSSTFCLSIGWALALAFRKLHKHHKEHLHQKVLPKKELATKTDYFVETEESKIANNKAWLKVEKFS